MSLLSQMLAGVVDPRLEGAACAGRHALFDPPERNEDRDQLAHRHAAAARICATCPVLNACTEVAADLPKARRVGVWAGTPYDDQGRATNHRIKENTHASK